MDSISLGPWGGSGGSEWSCMFDYGIISGIVIRHGQCIDSVTFKGGNDSEKFGGDGGNLTDEVNINWPTEYLVSISGTFETWYTPGTPTIRSLCFYTNLNTYGPFGVESGSAFTIPIKNDMVIGFHGRAGLHIDAIGVYVIPAMDSISLGPWGGPGGSEWSCKFDFGIITGIVIRHGQCIDSVAFRSTGTAWEEFGGNGGNLTDEVNINWPTEYLVNISGTFETWYTPGTDTIRSLCFYTNLNTYGPFGVESGTTFAIPIKRGMVVGFHGRAGQHIDAIGVYVKPISLCSHQPSLEFTENEQVELSSE